MKAKYLCLAIPLCFLMASAMSGMASADTIEVTMNGNDYDFEVLTRMNDLPFDNFSGSVTGGSMDVWQTIRNVPTGQHTYDGSDIDRYAGFNGEDYLNIFSEYESSKPWYDGHSMMNSYVGSDTSGYIGQNAHFDGQWGGVQDVDPWKKQRDMDIGATGNYEMGVTAADSRNSNWGFNFNVENDGISGDLHVDYAYGGTEHGSGIHKVFDTFKVNAGFNFTGTADIVCNWMQQRGGTISILIDTISHFFGMTGTIW